MKKSSAIYLSVAELEIIYGALDVMYVSDGQAHEYTEKQAEANDSARIKMRNEINARKGVDT